MIAKYGCFHSSGVLFLSVLILRALLFLAPDFWKLSVKHAQAMPCRPNVALLRHELSSRFRAVQSSAPSTPEAGEALYPSSKGNLSGLYEIVVKGLRGSIWGFHKKGVLE